MKETTEILYGNDEITKRTMEVFNYTEKTIEGCIGKEEIRTHVTHQWHMDGLLELRRRGVIVRVVTQVTHDNLPFCKIYSQAVELRHINGIQSSFGISDGKWLLDHIVSLDEFPLSHAILTNVTKLVTIKLQLFETLWNQSVPASDVFTTLDESSPPEVTNKIDSSEAKKVFFRLIANSKYRVDVIIPTEDCLRFLVKEKLADCLEIALKQGVKIRILLPKGNLAALKYLNNTNFEVKEVDEIRTKRIVLLSDNQSSLAIETSQSERPNHFSPLSKGIYSTGSVALMTLTVLFEKLWS